MGVVNLVGTPVTLEWTAADAASPTLTITQPDGSEVTPAITPVYSGAKYTATFTPALPGRHTLLWSNAAASHADIVDIWPEDPHYLVSRADAIERIRKGYTTDVPSDALMLYIASATAVVEDVTGPLIAAEKTWSEVPPYPTNAIVLPHCPIHVSEVTVDGSALAAGDVIVDDDAGIVHALSAPFAPLTKVTVTYTAGDAQIPPQARQACLEIIAHMWQATRQGARPTQAGEDMALTPMGFAIPKRALELLQSLPRTAGMA